MADTYKGESVGKKLARLCFWQRAQSWLGERFFNENHLVLASREGGDISVLKGLGVDPKRIVAVDRVASAARECGENHPDAVVIHGDAVSVARAYRASLASAFLDFCSWPTDELIDTIFGVAAHGLRGFSVLGYAYMRGREPKHVSAQLAAAKQVELGAMHRSVMHQLRPFLPIPKGARDQVADGRSQYIYNRVQERLMPMRAALFTLANIDYHSADRWAHGVPMAIRAKWMHRDTPGSSEKAFRRRMCAITSAWWETIDAVGAAAIANGHATWGTEAPTLEYVVKYRGHAAKLPIATIFDREFVEATHLVRVAEQLDAAYPGKAELLLNIPKGRLAAIRAHATRGTYDKEVRS